MIGQNRKLACKISDEAREHCFGRYTQWRQKSTYPLQTAPISKWQTCLQTLFFNAKTKDWWSLFLLGRGATKKSTQARFCGAFILLRIRCVLRHLSARIFYSSLLNSSLRNDFCLDSESLRFQTVSSKGYDCVPYTWIFSYITVLL